MNIMLLLSYEFWKIFEHLYDDVIHREDSNERIKNKAKDLQVKDDVDAILKLDGYKMFARKLLELK